MPKEPKPPKPPSKKLRKEFFKPFASDDVAAVTAHLDAGVDPNRMFQLDSEYPALAVALDRNSAPRVARLLLDRGIDVKIADVNGVTALHRVHDRAFAKELLERGADPNAKTKHDRTPLHTAADNKLLPVVEELVAAGATVDARDGSGRTPYQLAKHVGIRAHLRAHGATAIGPGGGHVLTPVVTDDLPRSAVDVSRGALGTDRDGNIWMGGYQGIFRFDGTKVTGFKFQESFAVGHIAGGPSGVLYIATNWGLLRFANNEWRLYTSEDSELFDHHLTFLTTAPDGRAFMISYESEAEDKHISIFDGETSSGFSVLAPGRDLPLGLELERIAFDARGEMMLAGQGGLATKQNGEWVITRNMDPKLTFTSCVYSIVDDGEALWVGTQQGVFERRGDTVTNHDVKKLAKHLLKDGNTLWVGTYYGGLAKIVDGAVTIFDEKTSPLPDDDIQGLVRATDGTIWIHTGRGVATLRDGELAKFE